MQDPGVRQGIQRVVTGFGKGIYNTGSGIYQFGSDLAHVGSKFMDFLSAAVGFGFEKYPLIGILATMVYAGKVYAKKRHEEDYTPTFSNSKLSSIYVNTDSGRVNQYRNHVDKRLADQLVAEAEKRHMTTAEYFKGVDMIASKPDMIARRMNNENVEYLSETFGVHQLQHALKHVSKMPGITFEDKSKISNALLALRTQQYKEADKLFNQVSESARVKVQVELGVNSLDQISMPQQQSPFLDVQNKLVSGAIGAASGSAIGSAIDPFGGAVLGGIAGAMAGFKTYDKYKKWTHHKSDFEKLQDRVTKLEGDQ